MRRFKSSKKLREINYFNQKIDEGLGYLKLDLSVFNKDYLEKVRLNLIKDIKVNELSKIF